MGSSYPITLPYALKHTVNATGGREVKVIMPCVTAEDLGESSDACKEYLDSNFGSKIGERSLKL